jgi:hypothetical protein
METSRKDDPWHQELMAMYSVEEMTVAEGLFQEGTHAAEG